MRPSLGRIERTRFSPSLARWEYLFYPRFRQRLIALCREHDISVLHAIPHGVEFWLAYQVARELDIPYVLNVHDHLTYNMPGFPYMDWVLERLERVWCGADQRFVISDSMGEAYCDMFGDAPYTTVTDGLTDVAADPLPRPLSHYDVYFMGALHLSYHPNLNALLAGLSQLHAEGQSVTFTSRGSAVDAQPAFPVTNLPWASEAEVARDFEKVSWLYFPLPFDPAHDDFVRYSLSTKLVTYLGVGLPILYHGPAHAAAARLLNRCDAAVQVHTLEPEAIAAALTSSSDLNSTVNNALGLARDHFQIEDQRRRFWDKIATLTPLSGKTSSATGDAVSSVTELV
jgi:hypothetical protein